MRANRVLKVPMSAPDDVSGIEGALERAGASLSDVRAVMCMTEGDGFARGFAALAFAGLFHEGLGWSLDEVASKIPLIMIGGCSGLVAPYAAVFIDDQGAPWGDGGSGGLGVGVTTTDAVPPEAVGTLAMVDTVAASVRSAMAEIGITDPADVHNVQVKTPWPHRQGVDPGLVGAQARAAGALGVAVALGEVDRAELTPEVFLLSSALRSDVASVSAGTERTDAAVLVLGNSPLSSSPYRVGHAVLEDGLDVAGVYAALRSAGIDADRPLAAGSDNPVDHVFLKSAVDGTDECRGRRHVLRTDYLGPFSWLLGKAVIHATVASIVGDPMMQVSGGGEYQGPPGGGSVAVIAR